MKDNHYKSIQKILLFNMILVPLLPLVLILGVGYYYFTTSLETNTISNMERIVSDHRLMIETFLAERKADLDFILHSYTFEDLSQSEKLPNIFACLLKNSNAFLDLGVFDDGGVHVAYQGPYKLTGKVYKDASWFKKVLLKGYYISDIFLGYRQIPHFVIAVAKIEKGKKWVIRATIDPFIFNNLVEEVRIGKTGEAYILNGNGIFQTKRRSGGNLMDRHLDDIQYPESNREIKSNIVKDSKGERYLLTTTWMKGRDWLLVVRQKKADAFGTLISASYLIVLIMSVGVAGIISIAVYLSNRIVMRMEDLDEEKDKLSQQLIRASRLAELGEMAAGFAHEINNPLQIIKNEQSLIEMNLSEIIANSQLRQTEAIDEMEESIEQIKIQINRCAEITQAILKFGRQNEYSAQQVDLRLFIPEVIALVEQKARVHGIAIVQSILEETPPIYGDPSQLQQVLLNLLNNAIDAIVERHGSSGGKLAIYSKSIENGKIRISVKDNGCGISLENLQKVFTPFFTTKPIGKGTGLGLSVCYGIIDNMGGTMEVSSKKGVGTSFTVGLPAAV